MQDMRSFPIILVLAVCPLLAMHAGAAVRTQPGVEEQEAATARVTSTLELARLVDLATRMNGVEIEYDPSLLRNKSVTLRLIHDLEAVELWDLALSLLHSEQLTVIQRGGREGLFTVVRIQDAGDQVLPADRLRLTGIVPGYQSVVRDLTFVKPEEVSEALKPVLSGGSKLGVTPNPALSSVVVSGLRERVAYALGIIDRLDVSDGRPEIAHIPLTHRSAIEVVAEVRAIIETLAARGGTPLRSDLAVVPGDLAVRVIGPEPEFGRIRELIHAADRPSQLATRSFDARGYPLATVARFLETMARDASVRGSGDRWRVVQDELTNALIVTGTESELRAAERAIEQLSSTPASDRTVIRMIPVKNREASTISQIAGRILGVSATGERVAEAAVADDAGEPREPAGGRSGPARGLGDDPADRLQVSVDEEMNTIIATGPPRLVAHLEDVVRELDVRQPQVQLEVILLSLSESETRDLGVELSGVIDTGDTLIGLGSLFGLSSVTPSSGGVQASGSGGSAVILSPGDFSAVIRAIQTVNSGRSVTMPSVVVNNNQTATLNSTTTQPFLTTTITDSNITTSRGGSASAGTTITVSPQIAAGDHIVLDYSFTLSSFVGEASSDGVEPPTQQTSLNSVTSIPDGYTIVLGGIESTSEGDSDTKTPLLADIPLLGQLFQSQSDSTSRSRFYVFIRATVMRSPSFEYLKFISEDLANELGVDDGWPEVEPRVIR